MIEASSGIPFAGLAIFHNAPDLFAVFHDYDRGHIDDVQCVGDIAWCLFVSVDAEETDRFIRKARLFLPFKSLGGMKRVSSHQVPPKIMRLMKARDESSVFTMAGSGV